MSTDCYFISFPKSGRTWVRVMIARALAEHYGLDGDIIDPDEIVRRRKDTPRITFTHAGSNIAREDAPSAHPNRYRNKAVIFLARDPRDVVVSYYF